MKVGRQEYLSFTLGGLVLIIAMLWAVSGIQQHELVLETRKQIYCFSGYLKYVMCFSVMVFCPSMVYSVYFGYKLLGSGNKIIFAIGSKSFFLLSSFLLSMVCIVICIIIASFSCA